MDVLFLCLSHIYVEERQTRGLEEWWIQKDGSD